MAFPEIQKEAKKCGAQVYFADEASVRSDYHSGTTWAPVGETPVVGKRQQIHTLAPENETCYDPRHGSRASTSAAVLAVAIPPITVHR